MNTQVLEKRGRGRPESFPGVKIRVVGFGLPVETIDMVQAAVEARNERRPEGTLSITQAQLVDRALRAYLRVRKAKA